MCDFQSMQQTQKTFPNLEIIYIIFCANLERNDITAKMEKSINFMEMIFPIKQKKDKFLIYNEKYITGELITL